MTTTEPDTVERMLPLYQGMMVGIYDHRVADVVKSPTALKRQNQPRYLTLEEHQDPARSAVPAYWVREELVEGRVDSWVISFADVTSATNERTLVPSVLPKAGYNHKLPLILSDSFDSLALLALAACLGSYVVDYQARQKVGGTSMTYFYVKQLPVLSPETVSKPLAWDTKTELGTWAGRRVVELVTTAYDLDPAQIGRPYIWDPVRRELLRAELDAAFFHLYGIERDDVDYIMETFPIVKRKDMAAHGEYRTKRLILEVFDAMQVAIDTGGTYETILDPPPGEGERHPDRGTDDAASRHASVSGSGEEAR